MNGGPTALEEIREEMRGEIAQYKGEIVRYVSERDRRLSELIENVRDELVLEIRNVKATFTDPEKWAETSAVREFKLSHFGEIEHRAHKAERGRTLAYAVAGAVTLLSPAIAEVLKALAHWIEHMVR